MKRSRFLLCAIFLVFGSASVLAADVTGTWTGTFSTPNGELKTTYVFRQGGDKLTGTVTGPQGDSAEIHDGKVDGNKLSFGVTAPNGMLLKHEGTISGDEIKLTLSSERGEFQITLKRSN